MKKLSYLTLGLLLTASSAFAVDIIWQGGGGLWNTDSANLSWSSGAAAWDNASNQGDTAVFSSGSGTVALDSSGIIDLAGLRFTVKDYTISGGTLNFGGQQGSISTSALGTGNNLVTIASALTGTSGLVIAANGDLSATGNSSGGRLIISGNNTGLTGDISITGGLVAFANSSAAGSAATTAGSGNKIILSNGGGLIHTNSTATASTLGNNIELSPTGGTIRVYGSQTLTLNGVVSGSGALTKTDNGTLVLANANNTFTGSVSVLKGTLQLGNLSATSTFAFSGESLSVNGTTLSMSGTSPGNVTHTYNFSNLSAPISVNGGTLNFSSSNTTQKTFNGAIDFSGASTVNYSSSNFTHNLDFNRAITGTGVLNFTWSGNATSRNIKINGTGNNYTGNIVLGTASGAVTMNLAQTIGEADWSINNANWTVNLSSATHSMKSLNGSVAAKIQGNGANSILNVGSGNTDSAFSGTLGQTTGNTLALVKSGTGVLTLSGLNTFTGGTRISGGTLVAVNASALGTGAVVVENGGILEIDAGIELAGISNLTVNSGTVRFADGTSKMTGLSGNLLLSNATLDLMGLGLLAGNTYDLNSLFGTTSASFNSVNDILLGNGLTYEWANQTDGIINVQIPEPSTYALLGAIGAAGLVVLRRRKRS